MISEIEFAERIARQAMRIHTRFDCECMANSQLIEAIESGDITDASKSNILDEMRRRVRMADEGRTGYAGCSERFEAYIGR